MSTRQGTAHHPLRIKHNPLIYQLSTNWPVNRSGSDYSLYFNTKFNGIPADGDCLGIVTQLVTIARLGNSGITGITVRTHEINIAVSAAITKDEANEMLRCAVRRAAPGVSI